MAAAAAAAATAAAAAAAARESPQVCRRRRRRAGRRERNSATGRTKRYAQSPLAIAASLLLVFGGDRGGQLPGGVMGQVAEVSMSCDDKGCECTGSSDSGTIVVFENQSSGSLVAKVEGGYSEVVETDCGALGIAVGSTLYELSGVDLGDRTVEVVSMSADDCTVSNTPSGSDCYSGTSVQSLSGGAGMTLTFCLCIANSSGGTSYQANIKSSVTGAADPDSVSVPGSDVCVDHDVISHLVTVSVDDSSYDYNFDLDVPGEGSSADLEVASGPSTSEQAAICGDGEVEDETSDTEDSGLAPTPAPTSADEEEEEDVVPTPQPVAAPEEEEEEDDDDGELGGDVATPSPSEATSSDASSGSDTSSGSIGSTDPTEPPTPPPTDPPTDPPTVAPTEGETTSTTPAPTSATRALETPTPSSTPPAGAATTEAPVPAPTAAVPVITPVPTTVPETAVPWSEEELEQAACVWPPDGPCITMAPLANISRGLGAYYDPTPCSGAGCGAGTSGLCRTCYFNVPLYISTEDEEGSGSGSSGSISGDSGSVDLPDYPECPCCVMEAYEGSSAADLDGPRCVNATPAPTTTALDASAKGFDTLSFDDKPLSLKGGEGVAVAALGMFGLLTFLPFCIK